MRKRLFIFSLIFVFLLSIAIPTSYEAASKKPPTIQELQKLVTSLTNQVKDLKTALTVKTKENNKNKTENAKLKNENAVLKTKNNELEYKLENQSNKIDEFNEMIRQRDLEIKSLKQLSKSKIVYSDAAIKNVGSSSNEIKWYEFETKQAFIYMTESAYERHGYIVEISDEILEDISSYFVKPLSKKVKVFLWENESIVNRGPASYEIIGNGGAVFIKASNFYPSVKSDWNVISTFVHEVAHSYVDLSIDMKSNVNLINGGYNFWINEGLAEYIKTQHIDFNDYDIPKDHLKNYKRNPLEYPKLIQESFYWNRVEATAFIKLPSDPIFSHYGIYESLVYYLNEKYGKGKFLEFIEKQKSQKESIAFESVFGISEEDFINEWKRHFNIK
jgi:hypothetical protein